MAPTFEFYKKLRMWPELLIISNSIHSHFPHCSYIAATQHRRIVAKPNEPDDTCPAQGLWRHPLAAVVLDEGGVQMSRGMEQSPHTPVHLQHLGHLLQQVGVGSVFHPRTVSDSA